MDRRTFLFGLTLGTFTGPVVAELQSVGKVARIGYLTPATAASPFVEQFRQALREVGHVEGQNIALELRAAGGDVARLSALAAELVRLKVDVIVAVGNEAIRAAKDATRTIPIVMRFSTDDPVVSGFVASYARPQGNITGVTILAPALEAKRLELLREVVPGLNRIAVLVHPARIAFQLKDIREAARSLGVQLQVVEVREANQYAAAFSAMTKERAGALVVLSHPQFFTDHKLLIDLAARNRLPAMYHWMESVEAGGLMAYGPSLFELNRRAAGYVDRILKGAKPADLPVEGPTAFELVINLKTARALELAVPSSVVQRADRVIQ
jgi:putative tryptophan/tyrosine transport system substrate-binding protein